MRSSMKFCGMRPAMIHFTLTETNKAAEAALLVNQKIGCRLAGHLTGSARINPVAL
jgi:hypothetical protein